MQQLWGAKSFPTEIPTATGILLPQTVLLASLGFVCFRWPSGNFRSGELLSNPCLSSSHSPKGGTFQIRLRRAWGGKRKQKSTETAQFEFMPPLEKITPPLPATKKILSMFFQHFSDPLLAIPTEPFPYSLCRTHQPQGPPHSPYLNPSFHLISAVKNHRSRVLKTHLPPREKVNMQVGTKSRWCLKEIMIIKPSEL